MTSTSKAVAFLRVVTLTGGPELTNNLPELSPIGHRNCSRAVGGYKSDMSDNKNCGPDTKFINTNTIIVTSHNLMKTVTQTVPIKVSSCAVDRGQSQRHPGILFFKLSPRLSGA